jgi:hypothetical protein
MAKNDARCAHGDEVEGSFESAYAQEVCLIWCIQTHNHTHDIDIDIDMDVDIELDVGIDMDMDIDIAMHKRCFIWCIQTHKHTHAHTHKTHTHAYV